MKKSDLLKLLKPIEGVPNYSNLAIVWNKPMNVESVDEFNEITACVEKLHIYSIERTFSNGISTKGIMKHVSQWDWQYNTWSVELTLILNENGCLYGGRFQIGRIKVAVEDKDFASGRQCLRRFRKDCVDKGIDLKALELTPEEGKKVKATIEAPYIDITFGIEDSVLNNVHHIDFHSSHIAGIVKHYPQLKPVFDMYYNNRHDNEAYKRQLVITWGALQSSCLCRSKWAHISRDGMHDTNERLKEITERLKANGRTILAHNTDGVWYQGEIYHGEGEGDKMGEWQNDHKNCMIRFRSVGAYEFIENGKYNAVVRGLIGYDSVEPNRDKWKWGDIYKGDSIQFYVEPEERRILRRLVKNV